MKIGICLSNPPAYSETFFNSKISGLQKQGYKVALFVGNKGSKFGLCDIHYQPTFKNVFAVFFKSLSSIKAIYTFSKLERKDNNSVFEIVKKIFLYNHILTSRKIDWLHFGFGTQAIGKENIAKSIGAKMSVSFRGFDIGIYPLKYENCYSRLWREVYKVHVISEDILVQCYNHGMKKKTLVSKITPAIDAGFFHSDTSKDFSKLNFLTVGRLHWKKGYTDTLLALGKLKENKIPFKYTIVGTGSNLELERIKYLIYQLNITDEVELKGKLSVKEVKKEYDKSNYYIQYSTQEGFCNAVLEAQSMGLLPIVSNAEGLSENVLHTKTGWVIPKCKPELLFNSIIEISKISKNIKNEMVVFSKNRIKENFTIEKQQKEFIEFYNI